MLSSIDDTHNGESDEIKKASERPLHELRVRVRVVEVRMPQMCVSKGSGLA